MKTFLSLVSSVISAGNFGMNMYITKKQKKASKNRMIGAGIMVAVATGVSLANTMYIVKEVKKNGGKQ